MVPAGYVWLVSPLVAPILQRALDRAHERFTCADVFDRCADGQMQLWLGGLPLDGVAVTEIVVYPRKKEGRIVFGAGSLERGQAGLDTVLGWMRQEGCSAVEIIGRPGWERALPGFAPDAVVLRREFERMP